jgi:hypothetical protein
MTNISGYNLSPKTAISLFHLKNPRSKGGTSDPR